MPRELGKARTQDLVGSLPGESGNHVSDLAAFLQGSGQMQVPDPGSYLDAPSNGSGSDTEIGRGRDTEVAPAAHNFGGNGHAEDTVFDTPLASFDSEMGFGDMGGEMTPELSPGPLLTPMQTPQALTPQPLTPQSLGPVDLSPTPMAEPQSLESVPDLTSPELDEPIEEDQTEFPPSQQKTTKLPTVKAPASSSDTGVLEMAAKPLPKAERIDMAELAPQGADEETNLKDESGESEKITSKVDPRRDIDPRSLDPNAVMRDTVNFYNQTQSLHGERKAAPAGSGQRGFPTISPNAVNSSAPLDLRPDRDSKQPMPEPTLLSSDESDTLMPLSADPELASLVAESDHVEADRRDTDRFMDDDRRPPPLPQPEGVGAGSGRRPAARTPGELEALSDERTAAGKDTQRFYVAEILKPAAAEPADSTDELEPADTSVPKAAAPSGDTAPDYTSASEAATRIAYRKPEPLPSPGSVQTDFLERPYSTAAERLVPELEDESQKPTDKLPERKDRITEKVLQQQAAQPASQPAMRPAASAPRPASAPQVRPVSAPQVRPVPAPQPVAASRRDGVGSGRHNRISDSVSRRLRAERDETLKLIEAAEEVARRLRASSDSARADLATLSARRTPISADPADNQTEVVTAAAVTGAAATGAPGHSQGDKQADTNTNVRRRTDKTPKPPAEIADASVDWYGDADPLRDTASDMPAADMPEADGSAPASRRRERVPTRAIGEILDEIESKLQSGPALSDLLSEASARLDAAPPKAPEPEHDDDLDLWVAASGRLREIVESDLPRHDARDADDEAGHEGGNGHHGNGNGNGNGTSGRLSSEVEKLWHELDSRREVTVLPRSDRPRVVPASPEPAGSGLSQEAMWQTLVGIAAVTFVLGAFFVWLLHRLLA